MGRQILTFYQQPAQSRQKNNHLDSPKTGNLSNMIRAYGRRGK